MIGGLAGAIGAEPAHGKGYGAMHRRIIALAGCLAAGLIGLAAVALAGQAPSYEDQLRDAAIRIDRAAAPLGEAGAVSRLAAAFKVPERTVLGLHDEKLDFGEVALVLALADEGKTKPEAILSLWATGRLTWSEIAQRHAVDRKTLQRRLEAVRRALARPPAPPPAKPAR
jgi:hypothetical protein